jgi:hypothetical protein
MQKLATIRMSFYIGIETAAQMKKYSSIIHEKLGRACLSSASEEIFLPDPPAESVNMAQPRAGTDPGFARCLESIGKIKVQSPLREPVAFRFSIWHRKGGRQEPLPVRMRV